MTTDKLIYIFLQVQLDSVLSKFQALHHFFFILRKLFEEGPLPNSDLPENSPDHLKITKFSSQGGFLRQPVFDSSDVSVGHSSNVDLKLWEKFQYFLSEIIWPSVRKCLLEGKMFIDYSLCQVILQALLGNDPILFVSFLVYSWQMIAI